jgi:hypothetical protein
MECGTILDALFAVGELTKQPLRPPNAWRFELSRCLPRCVADPTTTTTTTTTERHTAWRGRGDSQLRCLHAMAPRGPCLRVSDHYED